MSESPLQTNVGDTTEDTSKPAVGLVATDRNADSVAGAILRASRAGHDAIVTAVSDASTESLSFARQLGAIVIPPETNRTTDEDASRQLTIAARDAGYPGLILHTDLTERVDYEASIGQLHDSSEYVTDACSAPKVATKPSILVAIPAYNEANSVGDVVSKATGYADTVLVVDDGSEDETGERAAEAGATVVRHEHNRGYGAALKTAFREADKCGAKHLVVLDADGQHDPSDISTLVDHQSETDADIVIGSRFAADGKTDLPLYRWVGIAVVNAFTNASIGAIRRDARVQDTQSGFRAYNRQAIASLAEDDSIGDRMSASTDILYHAHQNDYLVDEVGTTIRYDVENASTKHPITHGFQLVSNILQTVEHEHPVLLLGVPGFLATVFGLASGYWTFANYLSSGTFPVGLAIMSVFLALFGIFSSFTAIILHSLNQVFMRTS